MDGWGDNKILFKEGNHLRLDFLFYMTACHVIGNSYCLFHITPVLLTKLTLVEGTL